MVLFTKEWSDFDFLRIELLLPVFTLNVSNIGWDCFERNSSIEFDTYIKYAIEDGMFYSVSFRLLGFGLCYYRQTSY